MRRVKERVAYSVCQDRALKYMRTRHRQELMKASQIALAIWPNDKFLTSQGAGAAAEFIKAYQECLNLR